MASQAGLVAVDGVWLGSAVGVQHRHRRYINIGVLGGRDRAVCPLLLTGNYEVDICSSHSCRGSNCAVGRLFSAVRPAISAAL